MRACVQLAYHGLNISLAAVFLWLLAPFVEQRDAVRFMGGAMLTIPWVPFVTHTLFRASGLLPGHDGNSDANDCDHDACKAQPRDQVERRNRACVKRQHDGASIPDQPDAHYEVKDSREQKWPVKEPVIAFSHPSLPLPLNNGQLAMLSGIREGGHASMTGSLRDSGCSLRDSVPP